MKLIIETPQEMFELGKKISKQHKNILLFWDLWAGKTLFTKWFWHWLGINQEIIQSPTYTYLNSYENKLLHMDMYRIEAENDVWEKWINDQIENHEYIVIERPKFIETLDLDDFIEIVIEKDGERRNVKIK